MPKLRPILFNTRMVKAILEGYKTETRRIIKPIKLGDGSEFPYSPCALFKPPYDVGDYLYVRETYCPLDIDHIINGKKYVYKADCTAESERVRKELGYKWKPSIHMPKEAARLFLKVENVSIERLQDIDLESVHNEGINHHLMYDDGSEMEEFAELWDSTTSDPQYKWENDPWVWVIQFKVVDRKEVESWLKENAE